MSATPSYLVLVIPASVLIGFQIGGLGSFITVAVVFGVVPLLDAIIGLDTSNPEDGSDRMLAEDKRFG